VFQNKPADVEWRTAFESKLSLSYREQTLDRDILVDVGPVNPDTTTDEAPIAALGFGGLLQPLEPGEGRAEFAAVGENYVQGVSGDADIDGSRFKLDA
jgi:hypothetical protein